MTLYVFQEGQLDAILFLLLMGAELNKCDNKGRRGIGIELPLYNNEFFHLVQSIESGKVHNISRGYRLGFTN